MSEELNPSSRPGRRRRHPLTKEHFMEGTRQKWMAVFLLCGGGVAFMTAYYGIDPEPFMQFLTVACMAFVIGASASSVMKEYKRGNIEEERIRGGYGGVDGEEEFDYDKQYREE